MTKAIVPRRRLENSQPTEKSTIIRNTITNLTKEKASSIPD